MKFLKETLVIVAIAGFLAFLNNYMQPKDKQIPLIPKPVETVSDDIFKLDTLQSVPGEFKNISYEQIKSRINDPNVQIIDARPAEEWSQKHIGNSLNIFPYDPEEEYMRKILEEIPKDKKFYFIYCHGGNCDLSHMLAKDMEAFGFKNIFIYTGGWEEWTKKEEKK